MEPLWSPVVATGGKRWQIELARTAPEQAKTVAVGCEQLRETFDGKGRVDATSLLKRGHLPRSAKRVESANPSARRTRGDTNTCGRPPSQVISYFYSRARERDVLKGGTSPDAPANTHGIRTSHSSPETSTLSSPCCEPLALSSSASWSHKELPRLLRPLPPRRDHR